MKRMRSRMIGLVAALLLVAAGCGGEPPGGGGGPGAGAKVAFLMPDIASTRYELYDAPLFKARMKRLCPSCEVLYQNADADAAKQQQQADSMIAQGVKVIVIDPVDSAAAATIVRAARAQNIPIIAYDRPIPAVRADYYVSFDNERIGALIAGSLVDRLRETKAEGGVLIVNGSPTDAAAGLIKKGVHSAVDPSGFEVLAEYDTPGWQPSKAQEWVSGQIAKFPGRIAGVVAANDGTGGGAIAAFKAANVKVPPVSGNDAELAAVQRIVAGDQYNTISKPIRIVAEAAADVAHGFLRGERPPARATLFDTPSQLFTPTVVTRENVAKELLGPGGPLKAGQVCTAPYKAACDALGIR
ncbi:substrate-binding domain-containing protein [Bailinhaonella thermotolerans]|uniref:Sugar ABC transporter substrate-binding protein n=1 Tax=Bailinhaonella thermotolerans TaxID=1070861 RepID=A0A3A4AME5_9ACTN|nr:substrate-binding domain-containing protein [Bailinhaonella thermotolerans]RJL30131.1 sugar ABC transporter substrate-binding protein [Bailinhaonella thermotolerans]